MPNMKRSIWFWLSFIVAIILAIYFISRTIMVGMGIGPMARLHKTYITADVGNKDMTALSAAAALPKNTSFYSIDLDNLNANILNVPGVKDCAIRRMPNGNLIINVAYRKFVATYTDGDAFNWFFYMPFEVGAGRVDFHYVVGSESEKGNMPIRLYEDQDNSFMITASDGLIRDVKVTRSFVAGKLYTLVLTFDVDAAQTAAKLPGHLTKLQNTIVKENEDLRINFVDADAIEAGVPYLYEPSAAVANPTFESVEVSAALNPTVADSHAEYHGIYAPMDGDALHNKSNAYVLGPDQYLYAVSDLPANQTMAALRAYFVLNFPSSAGAAPKRLAKVVFNYEETEILTGMRDIATMAAVKATTKTKLHTFLAMKTPVMYMTVSMIFTRGSARCSGESPGKY